MLPAQIAVKLYRLSRFFYTHHLIFFSKIIKLLMLYACSLEIDYRVKIGNNFNIYHGFGVVVGGGKIGNNVHINQGVTIGGNWGKIKGEQNSPEIGDNVWIMSGAKVLGPIKVGNNVLIGANAVVIKDVPDNVVVGGVPAKIIREIEDFDTILLSGARPWLNMEIFEEK